MSGRATLQLCEYVAKLQYADLPPEVVDGIEELFLDWLGSALGSTSMHPIPIFLNEAKRGGSLSREAATASNSAAILCEKGLWSTGAVNAAWVNAASSHLLEQDDLHNSSVLHPATVVFPAALAVAQATGASGKDLLVASVAGYEAGCRIGDYLGRSHYKYFHTTGTVGTLAAAVAAGKLLGIDSADQMASLLGNAGTMAAGLWQFMAESADSKQLHTAKAASDGVRAAYMTVEGLQGARDVLEGKMGMAAGMSARDRQQATGKDPQRVDAAALVDRLGERWTTTETSYKWWACCRHTHPACDALHAVLKDDNIQPDQIVSIRARVHQSAIDVLGPIGVNAKTIHQAKFSMNITLSLIALYGKAGLVEFRDHALKSPEVRAMAEKVSMVLDEEVDSAYPKAWLGRVEVVTKDGKTHLGRVDVPKGDPGNSLTRPELEGKFLALLDFSAPHANGFKRSQDDGRNLIKLAWSLRDLPHVRDFA